MGPVFRYQEATYIKARCDNTRLQTQTWGSRNRKIAEAHQATAKLRHLRFNGRLSQIHARMREKRTTEKKLLYPDFWLTHTYTNHVHTHQYLGNVNMVLFLHHQACT